MLVMGDVMLMIVRRHEQLRTSLPCPTHVQQSTLQYRLLKPLVPVVRSLTFQTKPLISMTGSGTEYRPSTPLTGHLSGKTSTAHLKAVVTTAMSLPSDFDQSCGGKCVGNLPRASYNELQELSQTSDGTASSQSFRTISVS